MLVLTALALIVPPLWRQRAVATADMDGRNIAIAKTRLAEMQEQLQAGLLSPAQYAEQRTELEQALSDDLDIARQQDATATQGRWLVYPLVVILPLLAVSLYAGLGTYQALEPTAEMLATTTPATNAPPTIEAINKMVEKLAERMKTDPNNAEGWVMLGKSYKYLQQFPKAAEAFGQAYKLLGDNTEVVLLYADALAFANNEQMAGKPAELVFKVLAKEPDNITALWYGGMAKAQAGEAVEGVKLWRKLVALLPAGSQAQQETQTLLTKLEATVPGGVPKEAGATQPVAAPAVSVDIQVRLADELQTLAAPDDTVFIYAQALSGPKMPLAIVRKHVSDLPITVSLTDAQAMTPAMKLSAFPTVKLLARVSKSGNAMTAPGDLLGVVEQAATADKQSHTIIINAQVK